MRLFICFVQAFPFSYQITKNSERSLSLNDAHRSKTLQYIRYIGKKCRWGCNIFFICNKQDYTSRTNSIFHICKCIFRTSSKKKCLMSFGVKGVQSWDIMGGTALCASFQSQSLYSIMMKNDRKITSLNFSLNSFKSD